MRLRTQILILIAALMFGTLFAFERISSQTIAPELERQALEMVSLLSMRGRDSVEQQFNGAESDLEVYTRLFTPANGEMREPGPALLEKSPYNALSFFERDGAEWKWLGPKDKKPVTPPALSSNAQTQRKIQKSDTGWTLWLAQGERLLSVGLPADKIQPFREIGQASRAFLMVKDGAQIKSLADTGSSSPEEAAHWSDWITRGGLNDKVETVEYSGKTYYAALASSAKYPLAILTLWPQDEVHQQWTASKFRMRAVFAVLVGIAALLVLLMIRTVTAPLEKLEAATHKLAGGDFALSFGRNGGGEVGKLMSAFEKMSFKIQELLQRTKESTRMEMELQTAKIVQENFYPQVFNQFPRVKVAGRTVAASECGGDLWSCWETEKFVYTMIADATGHGVPAALITSSLHAVLTVLESAQTDHPDLITMVLRRAIQKSGRGVTCMTAILVQLEKNTGSAKVFNASHEPCYILPAQVVDETKWKDLELIETAPNPALGREGESAPWTDVQLSEGQRILLYTDGILELKTSDGKDWKDRQLLTAVLDAFRAMPGKNIGEILQGLISSLEPQWREKALVDDLSVVLIEWSPQDH